MCQRTFGRRQRAVQCVFSAAVYGLRQGNWQQSFCGVFGFGKVKLVGKCVPVLWIHNNKTHAGTTNMMSDTFIVHSFRSSIEGCSSPQLTLSCERLSLILEDQKTWNEYNNYSQRNHKRKRNQSGEFVVENFLKQRWPEFSMDFPP